MTKPRKTPTPSAVAVLDGAAIDGFKLQFRGQLLQPGDKSYHGARKIYNAMIDRKPRVIAVCADVADVISAVNFARDNHLPIAVRGGGHNVAGKAVCDDGLVIDLSHMRGVRVDPAKRTARVEGGALLGDFDHAAHAFGLATPAGFISTTGVGGLTLGGGFGHLSRTYGLTCDNLISADVVTADGRFITASKQDNADLFWALCGGGGNFGVVTSFEFRLHPVNMIYGGPILYPVEQSREVMRFYRDFIKSAPDDMSAFFAYLIVPPGPPFPDHLHNKTVCGLVACYNGPMDRAEAAVKPLREFMPPLLDFLGPLPYPALQSMFDAVVPPGMHHYWKADFMRELTDAAIEAHALHGPNVQNMHSTMHIYPLNGAVQRVGAKDTAFFHRDVNFVHVIVGIGPTPAEAPSNTAWVKDYYAALRPYSEEGTYVNFLMDEGDERIKATFGANYPRLAAIKAKYDPANLFRMNQNIPPAP